MNIAMTTKQKRIRASLIRYGFMIVLAIIFVFPIVFMMVSSLKPSFQILQDSSSLRAFMPVGEISILNYYKAFQRAPVGVFVFNSLLVTAVTMGLGLLINSLAGFALARMRWKGQQVVLLID